jgi:hypothetical protein
MPKRSFADVMTGWEKLVVTTDANKDDLTHLTELQAQLKEAMEGAKAANIRQSAFRAQQQQATRDLEGFLTTGADLATRLRNGIRTQYGLKGEKLTEFGLQPRRKPQKAKAEPAAAPTPPSEPSEDPNGSTSDKK